MFLSKRVKLFYSQTVVLGGFIQTGTRLSFAHFRITRTMCSTWKLKVESCSTWKLSRGVNIWTVEWFSKQAWNSNTEYLKPHCSVSTIQRCEYTKMWRKPKTLKSISCQPGQKLFTLQQTTIHSPVQDAGNWQLFVCSLSYQTLWITTATENNKTPPSSRNQSKLK